MTSAIDPNNINGEYPVAGVPNNTQGFRDNFTNIKTNFQSAADEITELQNYAVFKAALTGSVLDNNLNDNEIYAARIRDFSGTISQLAATAGPITIDYRQGHYQTISTTGSVSLAFSNFPASGTVGMVRVRITVNNVAHTLTLPAAVSRGTTGLQGLSGNIITFANTGTYEFAFLTSDGGTTITIFDLNRPLGAYQATTAAVSTTTGAVTVAGGVGIVGNLHVGGQIVGNITVTGVSVVGNVTGGNIVTANGIYGNILSVNNIGAEDSTEVKFITDVTFDDEVSVNGNLTITGNISPASATKIGGVRAGPGANISNTGLLTIDTANLAFSFGNFTANNNILEIVNSDEDMVLATNGNAEIQLVGNIGFYKPNGLPPNIDNRFFFAQEDGQINIIVANTDPFLGAVEIIGSSSGNSIAPGIEGTMLHITGQTTEDCRMYYDAVGGYVSFVGRRFNGNVASPTQVLSGQDVLRINATAATDAGVGNVAMAQISVTALEDQTTTAQGSSITFTVTPVGSNATSRVDVATISTANGVTATQFNTTGNVTGGNILTSGLASVTGNVTAGNVNGYVTLPAGTTAKAPLVFTSGSVLTTAAPGAMNYDGTIFYITPQGQERGLIRADQIWVPNSDYTITNQAAVQSMFGVGTDVSTGTRYAYRILSTIYKTANNITLAYALGGTATLARHTYQTLTTQSGTLASISSPSVFKNIITTGFATGVTVTSALNGAGYYTLQINGTINVTTGGTWFPQIGFSDVPGAGSYVAAGSSVEIWPIGAAGANVAIGNWA